MDNLYICNCTGKDIETKKGTWYHSNIMKFETLQNFKDSTSLSYGIDYLMDQDEFGSVFIKSVKGNN